MSKTISEELIELIEKKVPSVISDKINISGFFSLYVDKMPDLSHVYQLSTVLSYLQDEHSVE